LLVGGGHISQTAHTFENHYRINHADIGRAIAEDWQFPDELAVSIGCHHNPDCIEDEYAVTVSTLYIAN